MAVAQASDGKNASALSEALAAAYASGGCSEGAQVRGIEGLGYCIRYKISALMIECYNRAAWIDIDGLISNPICGQANEVCEH